MRVYFNLILFSSDQRFLDPVELNTAAELMCVDVQLLAIAGPGEPHRIVDLPWPGRGVFRKSVAVIIEGSVRLRAKVLGLRDSGQGKKHENAYPQSDLPSIPTPPELDSTIFMHQFTFLSIYGSLRRRPFSEENLLMNQIGLL
jgi:hypothetical protein